MWQQQFWVQPHVGRKWGTLWDVVVQEVRNSNWLFLYHNNLKTLFSRLRYTSFFSVPSCLVHYWIGKPFSAYFIWPCMSCFFTVSVVASISIPFWKTKQHPYTRVWWSAVLFFYVTIPKLGDLCIRTICVGSIDETNYTFRTVRYNTAHRQCIHTLGFSRIDESIYLIGLIKINLTFFCIFVAGKQTTLICSGGFV